jgi:hypothetical protein
MTLLILLIYQTIFIKRFMKLSLMMFYLVLLLLYISCKPPYYEIPIYESCGVVIGRDTCTFDASQNRWLVSLEGVNTSIDFSQFDVVNYNGKVYRNVVVLWNKMKVGNTQNLIRQEIGQRFKYKYSLTNLPLQTICTPDKKSYKVPLIDQFKITKDCQ